MAKRSAKENEITTMQTELLSLKLDHRIGKLKDVSQLKKKRRDIARLLTSAQAQKLVSLENASSKEDTNG